VVLLDAMRRTRPAARNLFWPIVALLLAIPSSAAAGGPGTWTRVTGEEAWFEPNLLRHDGRLHVGVREDESPLTYRMIHRSISSGGAVGASHTVAQGFSYLGYYPAFVEIGTELRMNFGAKADGDGYSNSHMMQVISTNNGDSWTAPSDTGVTDGPAESPSEMDGTTGPDSVSYYVWEGTLCICVQRYTQPVADADHTNFNDIGGNNYDPNIGFESASGTVWVVYLITGADNDGLYLRQVNTTNGEPVGSSFLLPGSFSTFQGDRLNSVQSGHVPMAERSQGGLFVAYHNGYPSPNSVRVWRVGVAGFETIARMTGIGEVAIAADPTGRMWGVWDRNGRIYARRSNESVSRWGKTVTVRHPNDTVDITTVQADAQARVVDVLAHSQQVGNSGSFHTQLRPGISFRASPGRFPREEPERVKFVTKDAGAPLANSRITVAGKRCRTNSDGECLITLGPYSERRSLRATATHSDYKPAKRTLRVTR
jgi:hypothetical protein